MGARIGCRGLADVKQDGDDAADAAADDSGDGHSFAAFAFVFGDLGVADDAEEEGQEGEDDGATGGDADDAEDEGGDAVAVAGAAGFDVGAFHGEGHAAGAAVVGVDGADGRTAGAADDLGAIFLAHDGGGAVAGGGIRMNRVGVLLDDLAGLGVDEAAVAVEDGDGDLVAAGGALAFLSGHGFGGFEA